MSRINYQRQLEEQLARIEENGARPRLLLHSCCAPCSSYVLEYLDRWFDITAYYYNPNIAPREEFDRRSAELVRLVQAMPHQGDMRVIVGDYVPELFYSACRGHEADPEGGERCRICFELRLAEAAKMAAREGCDCFTTSLTISPLKNADLLNAIGEAAGKAAGVAWLPSDFKKKNGYKRSCELSREYELYRQDYCGCVFSRMERDRRAAEAQQNGESTG